MTHEQAASAREGGETRVDKIRAAVGTGRAIWFLRGTSGQFRVSNFLGNIDVTF